MTVELGQGSYLDLTLHVRLKRECEKHNLISFSEAYLFPSFGTRCWQGSGLLHQGVV